jgi:hypothetical protein
MTWAIERDLRHSASCSSSVALKFMLPAIAVDPQAGSRFMREGRAA